MQSTMDKNATALTVEKNYMEKKELRAFAIAAGGQGAVYSIMSSYILRLLHQHTFGALAFVFRINACRQNMGRHKRSLNGYDSRQHTN